VARNKRGEHLAKAYLAAEVPKHVALLKKAGFCAVTQTPTFTWHGVVDGARPRDS
jgi:hypothetical protein